MNFRVSATRILAVRSCAAKWHFAEIQGLNKGTPAQALGTAVHAEIESYLKTGIWVEPQPTEDRWKPYKIAQSGGEVLMDLRRRVAEGHGFVEHMFRFEDLGPLPFDGAIDFYDPDVPMVLDHKTTSNLKAPWHKTPEELKSDLQLNMYLGAVAKMLGKTEGAAKIGHIRYSTVPPFASKPIVVNGDIAYARSVLNDVGPDMARMSMYSKEPIERVPGNRSECHKYGGCPYVTKCPHTKQGANMSKLFGSKKAVVSPDTVLPELIEKCRTVETATGKPVSAALVKMLLVELESQWDPDVAFAQVTAALAGPKAPTYSGWSLVFAMIMVLRAKRGDANSAPNTMPIDELAKLLGVPDADIVAAVAQAIDQFEEVWKLDGTDLELLVEISDEELTSAAESVDLAELPKLPEIQVDKPTTSKPETKPKTEKSADRQELELRCDVAEKKLSKEQLDALRLKIGVARPRKLSDDRLLEYVVAVERAAGSTVLSAAKPTKPSATVVSEEPSDLATALFSELRRSPNPRDGGLWPLMDVRSILGNLGFTGDDKWFFGVLGAGCDAGYWDHTTNSLTFRKPAAVTKPAPSPKPAVVEGMSLLLIGCVCADAVDFEVWLAPVIEVVEASKPEAGPVHGWAFNDGYKAIAAALKIGGTPELPPKMSVSYAHPWWPYLQGIVMSRYDASSVIYGVGR